MLPIKAIIPTRKPNSCRAILEDLREDPDALIEIILRQAGRIEENDRLREERDEAERAGKCQAAPFRVKEEKRSEDPAPPGREEAPIAVGTGNRTPRGAEAFERMASVLEAGRQFPMGVEVCGERTWKRLQFGAVLTFINVHPFLHLP